MLNPVAWTTDTVLSIRLRPKLFTLAQVRNSALLQFFDLASEDGAWEDVDLSAARPLFCVHVASDFLKKHTVGPVDAGRVRPDRRPAPSRMLSYDFARPGQADLIEMGERGETLIMNGAKLVRAGLNVADDLDAIYQHEYCGMFGSKAIHQRLTTYFDTGVNFDASKSRFFAGLEPPSAAGKARSTRARLVRDADPPAPDRWSHARSEVARNVRPHLEKLRADLEALPAVRSSAAALKLFEGCVRAINRYESDIETEEREAILDELYELGATVGLDPDSKFVESWRGDW